jgi:murein L,D-transpeptidase YafK
MRVMRTRVFTVFPVCLLCVIAAVAQSASTPTMQADRVLVLKKERTLELLRDGKILKSYKVALGGDPVGPKTRQGDHKTPEGVYLLDYRNAHSLHDWTDGCIAVTDDEIDEIWKSVPKGTAIEIRP